MRAHRAWSCALVATVVGCGGPSATAETSSSGGSGAVDTGSDIRPPGLYVVRLAPDDASLLDVTLYLAPAPTPVIADLPRAPGREIRRIAIRDVECDRQPIERGPDGWSLPAGCGVLRWRVVFERVPDAGYDPRSRVAIRSTDPSYWLVPGAAAFLVPATMSERPTLDLRVPSATPVFHVLSGDSPTELALPVPNELGAVYFAFGAFHEDTTSDGATSIRFLVDGEMEVGGLAPGLALDYLRRITSALAPSRILVFVLRRSADEPIASLAGNGVIVMNRHDANALDPWRSAQTAFLSAWLRIAAGRRVPEWVSASLAAFYAERALREAETSERGAQPARPARPGLVRRLANPPAQAPGLTLLAAQRRVTEFDDRDAEAHFAAIGPGFWTALDQSIAAGSSGQRTLDDVAAEILELVYAEDGTPPQRFLALLTEAGAPNAAAICTAWLGWPS